MKKILFLSLALTLSAGMWAMDGVKYINANGQEQTANNVTEITNTSSTLSAGWYIVKGTNVQTGQLVCSGDVHIILADEAKLTASGGNYEPGVQVSGEGNSLTIYGQAAQSGQLFTFGGDYGAGIGGKRNGSGSNITINGGTITATGGKYGAGIGGGGHASGSNITINGGTVTATGGYDAAGIGGGLFEIASNITIHGGTVTATGGNNAAGIGGGNSGSGSNITIDGGIITANGGEWAAGIGGGWQKDGYTITIKSGTVTATGGDLASGIGGGRDGSSKGVHIFHSLVACAGNSNPPTEEISITRTDETDIAGSLAGKRYVEITEKRTRPTLADVSYIDENGENNTVKANTIVSSDALISWGKEDTTSWYFVVNETDIQFAKGAVCKGDVRLILGDGAKLTATGDDSNKTPGIQVSGEGDSLTIYCQAAQSGQLIANGGKWAAGIGGENFGNGSNITINGGTITATGGEQAAGIGGGNNGSGSNITINGGTVTAISGAGAAGIGGGKYAYGANIAIYGGTVTATGGDCAAGIGGGDAGNGSNITITGGTVTANGGENAAGIGCGCSGSCYDIHVPEYLIVKADNDNPPTKEVAPSHTLQTDIANELKDKRYAIIKQRTEPFLTSVSYMDEEGAEKTTDAYTIFPSDTLVTLGEAGITSWYVVMSMNHVQLSKGAVCQGNVRIILADEAKLTATGDDSNKTPGIQVSGEGDSLTIYCQAAQSGQLIAIGGRDGAGIGGGNNQDGSNITICGGIVSATGGWDGAGIGGGSHASGSNITIKGGTVTATGVSGSAGIGGGWKGSASNIFVDTDLIVKADNNNPPKTIIASTRTDDTDIANELNGKKYVAILPSIISIAVKTDPTKVNYIEDEKFDPAGLVITATYSDNTTDDFAYNDYASNFTFSPALDAGLQISNTQVTITYGGKSCTQAISVVAKKLLSIVIKTVPTKLEYNIGEHFNPAGLVITAAYNNNIPVDVAYSGHASDFSFDPALDAALQISTTKVTITYGGKSCTQPIVMFDKEAALAEIAAAMEGYEDSEYLNGLVATQITAIQNATTAAVVTSNKKEAIAIIQDALPSYKVINAEGVAAGYLRAYQELPTDDEDAKGAVVTITKGDKTLKLVNPDFVEYDKQ